MAYCGQSSLVEYLNFSSSAEAPVKAVYCTFVQSEGAGMGPLVFGLIFFGALGLALSWRVQHPGPLLVAGILTGGLTVLSAPGNAVQLLALVLFLAIGALGLYIYQRAQSSL